jgi:predicted O-linked N-acetylglucosamine transferase (SPINDLY family)
LPRIGFVSADFNHHAVGELVVPAIEGLAQAGFTIACYSNSSKNDLFTERFVRASTLWRNIVGLSDDSAAALIRSDDIDILIDLSGYTAGNRLQIFARKPAPLQVASWVGYPATTGMAAMDYILADHHQLPTSAIPYYSEAVVRLPDSYIVFEPPPDAPPLDMLPALSRNGITFGSFNVLKKITPEVVAVWSEILTRMPTSRLLLKAARLSCPTTRQLYRDLFAKHGIGFDRLQFVGGTTATEHRKWMQEADIALDTFPYSGGRTTLETLWMGLPVITLPGETFGSRHSLSYLSNIGLSELAASDDSHYTALAIDLATDLPRLADLRAGLRQRLLQSPLCDRDRFTKNMTSALLSIWDRWCRGEAAVSFDVR